MFRTFCSWFKALENGVSDRHIQKYTHVHQFRKRSLRLESLENRQLLSVNPATNFEPMQPDLYPMTLEESIASSSIANTSSAVQAETAYAALVAENENGEISPNYMANSNTSDVLPVFWFDVNSTKPMQLRDKLEPSLENYKFIDIPPPVAVPMVNPFRSH